jgi:peptide chain release factor 2
MQLELQSGDQELWSNPAKAQQLMKQISDLREEVVDWNQLNDKIHSLLELAELGDMSLADEIESELGGIEAELDHRELTLLLSGQYDKGNALLAIHAGAGGTESQDWADMLQRMYLRWAEQNKFEAEILDFTPGEEAGIKTVTIAINGKYAYGNLQSEKGTHRLVRISPYDANHRRHTSFAMVEILPEVDDNDEITIQPDEIKVDVYKSSGAGGQNVQKNATAIRITHLPTGMVVSCQNERSQLQNRESALRVLRARLLEIKQEQQDKELAELRGEYKKAEWGSQIRSYVLHPYQLVKDHRTNHEEGNAQAVLDGNLNPFIEAYLRYNAESDRSGGQ